MTWLTVKPTRRSLPSDIDRMFDNFFDFPAVTRNQTFWPAVDIHESDDELILTMEAPGVDKKDIKVTVRDRVLTIEGKRELKHEEKNGTCLVSEIRSGSFARSFTLPNTVDSEKIKAEFSNGLLNVHLAKLEEIKPKEIEVNVK